MELLQRSAAALAVIDVQERLLPAIPEEPRASVLRNALILIETARALGVPVLASEQYPKGLGPTVPEIRAAIGDRFAPVEKLAFSCGRSPEFRTVLEGTHKRSIVLCGVETHVCVLQTAVDLVSEGYRVFVPADAVASRRPLDWERGLALMDKAGVVVGTTEAFVFQLLERAGTDEFKRISKLLR